MSVYTLKNNELIISVKSAGAELTSIKDASNQTEYLWCGDSEYWGRQSPILFPFVGSLKNKEFQWQGKVYPMGQHGFARDMDFELKCQSDNEIWFELYSDEETKNKYPFDFTLSIGYRLVGRKVVVMWKVANEDKCEMPFSIGGHPAFMCPLNHQGKQTDYYIITDAKKQLVYGEINESGLLIKGKNNIIHVDEDGAFKISEHLFDNDALIVEGKQISKMALAGSDKKPYVTLTFDMPLCGIWSPAKKNAPFICLEPWYGRCDAADFDGELDEREYGTVLKAGDVFETSYEIEV